MVYTLRRMKNGRFINLLLALLRLGLGVFFLITGVQKIAGIHEMADFLTRSRILPAVCSLPLACLGLAMELVVAVFAG